MGYFDPATGKVVCGKVGGGTTMATKTEVETAISEAISRCQNKKYGSPRKELAKLLTTYPHLKRDTWAVGEHPLSPLITLFVEEVFR
jgi:hypothetical protein